MFSKSKLEFRLSLYLLTWALLMAHSKATATEHFLFQTIMTTKRIRQMFAYPGFTKRFI